MAFMASNDQLQCMCDLQNVTTAYEVGDKNSMGDNATTQTVVTVGVESVTTKIR